VTSQNRTGGPLGRIHIKSEVRFVSKRLTYEQGKRGAVSGYDDSAEPIHGQSGCGLGRQSFHANLHRCCFAGRNQTSNSLISFPDDICGERQRYARPSQTLFFGSI